MMNVGILKYSRILRQERVRIMSEASGYTVTDSYFFLLSEVILVSYKDVKSE